jgi:hypothetical protein
VKEEGQKLVRVLCRIEAEGVVQIGDQEGVEAYRRSTTFSITSGGAVDSGSGGLAAMSLGFGWGKQGRTVGFI